MRKLTGNTQPHELINTLIAHQLPNIKMTSMPNQGSALVVATIKRRSTGEEAGVRIMIEIADGIVIEREVEAAVVEVRSHHDIIGIDTTRKEGTILVIVTVQDQGLNQHQVHLALPLHLL